MVFKDYANYYDLLYSDKNYEGECDYIRSLINRHAPDANKILEFGSGSGIHGRLLAQTGFEVGAVIFDLVPVPTNPGPENKAALG